MTDGGQSGRRAEAERLRDYFSAQLHLAERIAQETELGLGDACLTYTNLHRRFGLGRASEGGAASGWLDFAAGLEAEATRGARLDRTLDFFVAATPEAPLDDLFGCFRHDPPTVEGIVRIHFHNRDSADGTSPLAAAKAECRRAELGAMFRSIRVRHPQARTVLGGSWLYNLEAYRRLFPPDYRASCYAPERVRLDGTSSWGQLLDFRGEVKPAVLRAFLQKLDALDPAAPWRSFPMPALGATAPIESFYRFYGV